jgi:phospholipid-binding lipoprotein MlaA
MIRLAGLLLLTALIAGCATGKDPRDPFEPFNRRVYKFNDGIDKVILEPTARVYRRVMPSFVRTGVTNFFSNLRDVRVTVNNLAQGKLELGMDDFSRVVINSSIGLLGLFDVASGLGIERRDEDFGQTLGWYGVKDGPYIMIPLFGPSTTRDLVAWPVDIYSDPVMLVDPTGARYAIRGARIINTRAELVGVDPFMKSALDPYEFLRDAYLQRRRRLIYDGRPPPEGEPALPAWKLRKAPDADEPRKWME